MPGARGARRGGPRPSFRPVPRGLPAGSCEWVRVGAEGLRAVAGDGVPETAWFLCEADYAGTSGAAFRRDEWERMSLEAAGVDGRLAEAVSEFRDVDLPFLLSVGNGYAYFAVRTAADGFGRIVARRKPELRKRRRWPARLRNSFPSSLMADFGYNQRLMFAGAAILACLPSMSSQAAPKPSP